MTVYQFIECAIDESTEATVFDFSRGDNVFKGTLDEIADKFGYCILSSWELYDGQLILNLEDSTENSGDE